MVFLKGFRCYAITAIWLKEYMENVHTRQHKLWYQSSYDRGLQHLLKMWPKIRGVYPDATLDIAYGWDLFLAVYANNPERMAWKERIDGLMNVEGITHHGRVGKTRLAELRKQCGIWAYPTDFDEINCIGALESQQDGCVPCVINKAALKETVGSGVKVEGDIWDPETRERYLQELLALMGDEKRWLAEQEKGRDFAKQYAWPNIARRWKEVFCERAR